MEKHDLLQEPGFDCSSIHVLSWDKPRELYLPSLACDQIPVFYWFVKVQSQQYLAGNTYRKGRYHRLW
jgi:hypothetical protein